MSSLGPWPDFRSTWPNQLSLKPISILCINYLGSCHFINKQNGEHRLIAIKDNNKLEVTFEKKYSNIENVAKEKSPNRQLRHSKLPDSQVCQCEGYP